MLKICDSTMITKLICLIMKDYLPVKTAEEVVVGIEEGVIVGRRVAINEPSAKQKYDITVFFVMESNFHQQPLSNNYI